MTVCPCCGFKFAGELREGCAACGAQAVGEPLAQPEHELPFYGRALLVGAVGALMLATFLASTITALLESTPVSLQFWSIIAAAETAAWRLKWLALPVSIVALWGGSLLYASINRAPARFAGQRVARGGLAASALATILIATFIGVTVPERLRQRQRGLRAAENAKLWTLENAFLRYKAKYGTLPSDLKDLHKLPDPDGSLAAVLAAADQISYKPTSDLAASRPNKKSRLLRGAVLRRAATSASTDDVPDEGLSFTNYKLVLPGEDKVLGTEDDRLMSDGVIVNPARAAKQISPASTSDNSNTP